MSAASQADSNTTETSDGSMLDCTDPPSSLGIGYILAIMYKRYRISFDL